MRQLSNVVEHIGQDRGRQVHAARASQLEPLGQQVATVEHELEQSADAGRRRLGRRLDRARVKLNPCVVDTGNMASQATDARVRRAAQQSQLCRLVLTGLRQERRRRTAQRALERGFEQRREGHAASVGMAVKVPSATAASGCSA